VIALAAVGRPLEDDQQWDHADRGDRQQLVIVDVSNDPRLLHDQAPAAANALQPMPLNFAGILVFPHILHSLAGPITKIRRYDSSLVEIAESRVETAQVQDRCG